MAGLCEGGNEPPGSLKARPGIMAYLAISDQRLPPGYLSDLDTHCINRAHNGSKQAGFCPRKTKPNLNKTQQVRLTVIITLTVVFLQPRDERVFALTESWGKIGNDDNNAFSESAMRISYKICHEIAKELKTFNEGEFIKRCLIILADELCPQQIGEVEAIRLSRRTVDHGKNSKEGVKDYCKANKDNDKDDKDHDKGHVKDNKDHHKNNKDHDKNHDKENKDQYKDQDHDKDQDHYKSHNKDNKYHDKDHAKDKKNDKGHSSDKDHDRDHNKDNKDHDKRREKDNNEHVKDRAKYNKDHYKI
ncbi:hypothetical protein ANN_04829 [Periplaneta americana]|uniref:Uncharacterized protein n=1 Tax=Periplaneta americana TaxID=6978 RepID=A0ABQ8TB39_PERAM|nr:hypothetical protein ANN_04829 [Periplaneta americana]